MANTLTKEKKTNRFHTNRKKSENEKEIDILKPELKEFITIRKQSKKYKQFQNFE